MKQIAYTLLIALAACSSAQSPELASAETSQAKATVIQATKVTSSGQTDTAILAGGCFWCIESDFEKLSGVTDVVSGYTGDDLKDPTYRDHGNHVEAVKVTFDPKVINYDQILDYYWRHIDPTDDGGQFCDRGHAYIPVIYARPAQLEQAKASKAEINEIKPFKAPIVVPILPAKEFWVAENYHQDYYLKNPVRYNRYRRGCRRDAVVNSLWGSSQKVKANTSYGSGN